MSPPRFKLAFIGTHGVGKTTLCYGLAARLKRRDLSLDVVHEVARRCPLPINEGTTAAAQQWILHTQIAEELLAGERYPVVLADRSVLDNYVYLLLAGTRLPAFEPLLDTWLTTYDLLVHVPLVETPADDGFRAVDPHFQRGVDERLQRELAAREIEPLRLDPGDRNGWIDRVEQRVVEILAPAQRRLL